MPKKEAQQETVDRWEKLCIQHLVGKTIKEVRYMTNAEQKNHGWFCKPLVIFFTDGSFIYPSKDDEGNDAGALFASFKDLQVIPVIY